MNATLMIRKPEMTKTYHGAFSGKNDKTVAAVVIFCHDERTGQSGCVYTEYTKIEATFAGRMHDRVLSRTEEMERSLYSVRIFAHHFSAFRALEHSQRVLRMQATINDQLENRIQLLEQTLASLNLMPAAAAACKSIYFGCYDQFQIHRRMDWERMGFMAKNERRLSPALN